MVAPQVPHVLSITPNGRSGEVCPASGSTRPKLGVQPPAASGWPLPTRPGVLALSPEADTAGMRAQFICHWQYAEIRQPGKPSWNLEPWRPVVDDSEMLASGCNPGSPEESF